MSLQRSTPSAQHIDASGIDAFISALEATPDVEPHSLMVLRAGQVVAEGWWAPYSAERVHLLYSLSKSFTSTAVGMAVGEGLLSLDDTVISHFPELDAEITDPRSRAMLVRHVLAMASGHREETIERAHAIDPTNLVRGFLLLPPDEDPGTLFAYNQPCTYTAAAIVQRITGGSLTDYLRPRLLDPLGIGDFDWQRDDQGHELGYSGLHARTEAVAALGQLYLQGGAWEGRQLLSPEWVAEATRAQVANGDDPSSDWAQGYGFQFWIARHGFRGDGAYGQFCVVLPDHDVVLALTGQSLDMQAVLNAAWEHLLPAIGATGASEPNEPSAADDALVRRLAGLALPPLTSGDGSAGRDMLGTEAAGRSFTAAPTSELGQMGTLDVVSVDDELRLVLHEGEDQVELSAGFGAWRTHGPIAASAALDAGVDAANTTLRVDAIFVETPHRLHLVLDLDDGTFTACWETIPLRTSRLAEVRRPSSVAPGGALSSVW
ncbi:MAG TPA: serine hydrolase domain-containing protein [Plantibacter sp.]|uniref:serine hydrolase domain-containing protein n=1 Tax=unclassified Plantibacter TaxID=2624265 RepID=UPI002C6DEFAA|nr:serine hydrolase domain-containing protein [Plantibacter sp.]